MKNVLIDMEISKEGLNILKSIPNINIQVVEYSDEERELPKEILKDKQILFCMQPPKNFSDMTSLEFIQISSAGYTQLFNLGLVEKSIKACNAQGVFDVPIAEWCIAMMINLARDLRGMIRNQDSRIWDRSARFQREIRGSLVGIWGYGAIGRETARLAKAMGMKIYVMDKYIPPDMTKANKYRVKGTGDLKVTLPDKVFTTGQEVEFLKELDFLIMCMPLTNNTRGIVGEKELRALPSTACILNPARGPIIEEDALLAVLRKNLIAGAALDTHYYYPMPADHPLWSFPNVIMTPHISGSSLTPNYISRVWDIFVKNAQNYVNHKPLLNELTASQLNGE